MSAFQYTSLDKDGLPWRMEGSRPVSLIADLTMYDLNPSLTIGDYTISMSAIQKGKVFIRHKSGEGGEFDLKKVEKVIAKFYSENF